MNSNTIMIALILLNLIINVVSICENKDIFRTGKYYKERNTVICSCIGKYGNLDIKNSGNLLCARDRDGNLVPIETDTDDCFDDKHFNNERQHTSVIVLDNGIQIEGCGLFTRYGEINLKTIGDIYIYYPHNSLGLANFNGQIKSVSPNGEMVLDGYTNYENGDKFKGTIKNGKREGNGILIKKSSRWTGPFYNNLQHGNGLNQTLEKGWFTNYYGNGFSQEYFFGKMIN